MRAFDSRQNIPTIGGAAARGQKMAASPTDAQPGTEEAMDGTGGGWGGGGWHGGYYDGRRYWNAGYYRWNGDWRWWGGGWNPWWVIPVPVPYPYYGGYYCPGYTIRRGFPGRIRGRNRFRPRRRESLEKISESVAETEIGLDKIVPGGMRSAPEPVVGRLAEDPDMRGKAVL